MLKFLAAMSLFAGLCTNVSFAEPSLKNYNYWTRIPQTSHTCQDEASLFAGRFAAATTLPVVSSTCLGTVNFLENGTTYTLYSLSLTYSAKTPVVANREVLGKPDYAATISDYSGAFKNYADCLASLSEQSAHFNTYTGLSPVAVWCEPTGISGSTDYQLRLESFGTAKMHLYGFNTNIGEDVPSDVDASIQALITGQGGNIVFRAEKYYLYYAPYAVPLLHNMMGSIYDTVEHCAGQMSWAREIVKAADQSDSNSVVACLPMGKTKAVLEIVRASVQYMQSDFGTSSVKYYTFEECVGDHDRAISEAKSRNSSVYGGLCTVDTYSDKWLIELYSQI